MEKRLRVIEEISERTSRFWTKSYGWAPKEAADLLSKSRLDWLDSFNRTLRPRVEEVTEHPRRACGSNPRTQSTAGNLFAS